MTKTKNRKGLRVLSLVLLALTIIALLFSLASCSSGEKKNTYDAITAHEAENPAALIARILNENSQDLKIKFLAASNGYDLDKTDFNDDDVEKNDDGTTKYGNTADGVTAAKAVLDTILSETARFAATTEGENLKEAIEAYRDGIDEATVVEITKAVIDAKDGNDNFIFRTAPSTKTKTSFPSILLVWIGKFLGLITKVVGGYYVLAIMIFAIIVEILMLPMAIKQQKNTIGMAKLRPAIARIEKKYAGRTDQVTLRKKQEEIMALQQKEGFSPFSGCMPLLVQLIIVGFILYPIIQNPLRYMLGQSTSFSSALSTYVTAPKAAGGLGLTLSSSDNIMELLAKISGTDMTGLQSFGLFSNGADLFGSLDWSSIPKFTAFGINLGPFPSFTSILVLVPILNVIGQWASMFLNRRWSNTGYSPMGDNQDKFSIKMIDVLPLLMTVFILFKVPAMIGVYWFFRSLVSLGKQFIMKQVMPVPKYTAEELREIEKAEKERQKAQKAALKQQPKYRSLHYIDEDDYDELPEVKQNAPQQTKKLNSQDAPEIKD